MSADIPTPAAAGRLAGKAIVVTGAGSGIGRAAAELFAAEGARVLAADLTDAVEELSGGVIATAHCDVSVESDVEALIARAVADLGGLDGVFNNAGIEGAPAPLADSSTENFDRVIGVNLKGVYFGCKYALREMSARGSGSIVNTASVAGLVGFPGISAYCASKGGVIQLTKTAALECAATGVRVNAICPGVIQTPMVDRLVGAGVGSIDALASMEPVGHVGEPIDIAEAALYLLSDASRFVTGTAMTVDGGFVAQ